ncbi:hypothetical protein FA95DRAFT_1678142 [Auriscalpium vulgare]|uniref:Uncharacterized protein n=1 Tax=Auriscalpium vulgare TaxID=40419 RepID=A0ACB8RXN9_9AGAM|nr:hypothetical protein FA95DRAFT_1678142 [Auriscalpium vulgare]
MFAKHGLAYAFLTVFVAGYATLVNAAPLSSRTTQAGVQAECTVDLLRTVVSLRAAGKSLDQLATSLANTSASTSLAAAQTGIAGAQDAIDSVATGVLANQAVNATGAQQQVQSNITVAINALSGIANGTFALAAPPPAVNSTAVNATSVVNATAPAVNGTLSGPTASAIAKSIDASQNSTSLVNSAVLSLVNIPTPVNLTADAKTALTNALELLGAVGAANTAILTDCVPS